jgi:endonuclease YncB( thermonuclease family)
VERVIDGDTLVVLIDTGFGDPLEEKLRLRGINTPELGTPEGEKAKKFVEKLLPVGSTIVFKSKKSTDPHGRFVVDLFYKKGVSDPEAIIADGVYLNQQLLDEGYAVRMAE